MEEKMSATLESIQRAAMQEFLDKGFQGASLRQIVKNAGVTTGAFYGYFSSKEALFNALVEPHAAALMGTFMEAQITFAELPEEQQPEHMGVESGTYLDWMVDYICQHREPVKLLLTRAEGTSYEDVYKRQAGTFSPPECPGHTPPPRRSCARSPFDIGGRNQRSCRPSSGTWRAAPVPW